MRNLSFFLALAAGCAPGPVFPVRPGGGDSGGGDSGGDDTAPPCEQTWFLDHDGDGYGTVDYALEECEAPAGYVENSDDCDDLTASVSPALAELCGDGVDNDCDGHDESCAPGIDVPLAATLTRAWAREGASAALAPAGVDLDGDGWGEVLVGVYQEIGDGGLLYDGAAYLFPGALPGEVALSDAPLAFLGEPGSAEAMGWLARGVGDIDGDGAEDLGFTATQAERPAGDSDEGALYLFSGADLPKSGDLAGSAAPIAVYGAGKAQYLGSSLASADLDGDGLSELLIGASQAPDTDTEEGVVYLLAGGLEPGDHVVTDIDVASFQGEAQKDRLGRIGSTALPGDLDGDGEPDVALGTAQHGGDSGALYVFRGPFAGSRVVTDADLKLLPRATGDRLGQDVSPAGDTNGDGYADWWVGAPLEDSGGDSAGAAYLVRGRTNLDALDGMVIADVASATLYGAQDDRLGDGALDGRGDADGDGLNDLLVGADEAGFQDEGEAYLFYGPVDGARSTQSADRFYYGGATGDHAGAAVAWLPAPEGDLLLIAAPDADGLGQNAGAIYQVSGER